MLPWLVSYEVFYTMLLLYSNLNPPSASRSISNGILMSDIRKRELTVFMEVQNSCWLWKSTTQDIFPTAKGRKEMGGKRMNKMFRFSDVKWLKQFLFKCKFDFLKDGTTSNCTLNGKMKINLKYGMNKVYVDFVGIIFYYENPDAFSFAQSILDFGQLWLGWNANIFNLFKHKDGRLTRVLVHSNQISQNDD